VVGIKHNKRKEKCAGSEDVTRDHRCAHLDPSVTSLARTSRLMRRRRYSHVDGRRLLVGLGSAASSGLRGRRRLPTRASLRIEEPPPPRVEVMELRPPAWDPPPLALWIGGRHRRPRNRRHRMSRSESHGHRSHWPGSTAARAIGQLSSLMNQDGA
jgi:hypothetical protein